MISPAIDRHPDIRRIDIRVVNTANKREHWATKAKRNKAHRNATGFALSAWWLPKTPSLPVTVTLTRIAPRPFDFDGLVISLKAVRDAVAEFYGVDDGPKETRITWQYAQRRGAPRQYAVEVRLEPQ